MLNTGNDNTAVLDVVLELLKFSVFSTFSCGDADSDGGGREGEEGGCDSDGDGDSATTTDVVTKEGTTNVKKKRDK